MSRMIYHAAVLQVTISQEISVFHLLGVCKKHPVVLAIASDYFL